MTPGDLPVEPKDAQAEELAELLVSIEQYCSTNGVSLREGLGVGGFDWVAWLTAAADPLLVSDEVRRGFLARADTCAALWKSVKPHPAATDAQPIMSVIVRLAQKIRAETGKPDISGVMADVERLLQESVGAVPSVIEGWKVVQVDLTESTSMPSQGYSPTATRQPLRRVSRHRLSGAWSRWCA